MRFKARVDVMGDRVRFDFSGTDAQRAAPMNCNLTQTFTACVYVLKCLIDPDIPLNEGFYQPIEVVAPKGLAVNPRPPTAIVGGWEVCSRLCDILFKAFSDALPEKVPAGTKAMICHAGFGGRDPRNGEYYCFLETLAGGYGARWSSDGPDAVQTHAQNTQNAPVEETERNYPVRIPRYSLVEDSEGPGRFRGGLGLCREYTFVDHEPLFTILADRARFPPWGLFGGEEGLRARYSLVSNGVEREIGSKTTVTVAQGDLLRMETCGGGGYGPPWERDPMLVLGDVRERKISVTRARERYGVAIDPQLLRVDERETAELRSELKRSASDDA